MFQFGIIMILLKNWNILSILINERERGTGYIDMISSVQVTIRIKVKLDEEKMSAHIKCYQTVVFISILTDWEAKVKSWNTVECEN